MTPIDRFKTIYNQLDATNVNLADELYDPAIRFVDPVKEIQGLENLKAYFRDLYDGVEECRFEFTHEIASGNAATLCWVMHLRHGKLKPKETVQVPGASYLEFGDKIIYHHDYFDLGKLIYERVPVLGGLIRTIKNRL
ncbi:MAG: nuclear transport factor 2 family protein [Sumerlaeia bacterium]